MLKILLNDERGLIAKVKDIEKNILNKKPFVLYIHALWCRHCLDMRPAWDDALKSVDKNIVVIEVESSAMNTIMKNKTFEKFQFKEIVSRAAGFPQILRVSRKNAKDEVNVKHYDGQRSTTALKKMLLLRSNLVD